MPSPSLPRIGLIYAQAHDRVIGMAGQMPWHLAEDLAHFKRTTLNHPVLMGRKTWDSLPERFRPLPGRRNVVITRQPDWQAPGAEVAHSLEQALQQCADTPQVWVIGGGELYTLALPLADEVQVTEIDLNVAGDTRAPDLSAWRTPAVHTETGDWQTSHKSQPPALRHRFVRHVRSPA
ncbi:dihydrofolate reductase [Comamonas serinivorans]|uniref:Dihydrofolate reductase n=1 Tax=Comamonas serinivorans TaxID=1082851 RepID=A0A1Y0EKU1_9BURK|nr:dihydrofolate reductase [Comamonas serinivorans]ARU04196.1 dihydrofolate reductase [Comamonas serinivorans]